MYIGELILYVIVAAGKFSVAVRLRCNTLHRHIYKYIYLCMYIGELILYVIVAAGKFSIAVRLHCNTLQQHINTYIYIFVCILENSFCTSLLRQANAALQRDCTKLWTNTNVLLRSGLGACVAVCCSVW